MQKFDWVRKQFCRLRSVARETGLAKTGFLLVFSIGIWLVWNFCFATVAGDYKVEFMGLIFDIVFILIILAFLRYGEQRQQAIVRQKEIIEDYKRWDSAEARFRLAGALRRLNRLGVTAIDFTGICLSDFCFADNKIRNISNSTFYDGSWGEPFKPHKVNLTNVSFDWLYSRNVQFSPFDPFAGVLSHVFLGAKFTDCSFQNSKLNDSSFAGASLLWTAPPRDSLDEDHGLDDEGNPIFVRAHYGPFDSADLDGVSFRNAEFKNADFRDAINVDKADFEGARGLNSCIFSVEALENRYLRETKVATD